MSVFRAYSVEKSYFLFAKRGKLIHIAKSNKDRLQPSQPLRTRRSCQTHKFVNRERLTRDGVKTNQKIIFRYKPITGPI